MEKKCWFQQHIVLQLIEHDNPWAHFELLKSTFRASCSQSILSSFYKRWFQVPQADTVSNRMRQQVMERREIQVLEPTLCNLKEAGRGFEKEVAAVLWSVCTPCVLSTVCLLPKPLHSIANTHQTINCGKCWWLFPPQTAFNNVHYQKDLLYYR